MNGKKILLLISSLSVISSSLYAHEVGLDYNSYTNGSGIEYYGSVDLPVGFSLKGGISEINSDTTNFLLEEESKSSVDINYVRYGLGYKYEIFKNFIVYTDYMQSKIDYDGDSKTVVSEEDSIEEPIEGDIPIEDEPIDNGEVDSEEDSEVVLNDYEVSEYQIGVDYRFSNRFGLNVSAIKYDVKDTNISIDSLSAKFTYYLNDNFKINLSYQDKDLFYQEELYKVGVSYQF
jgi:hypothetical protein